MLTVCLNLEAVYSVIGPKYFIYRCKIKSSIFIRKIKNTLLKLSSTRCVMSSLSYSYTLLLIV